MFKMWWAHTRAWFIHHVTMWKIHRGKLSYGRQPLNEIARDGSLVSGPLQPNVQVRHRIVVKARVFRVATGKYEDLGEIVNKEI
jgi:hypothetical protein